MNISSSFSQKSLFILFLLLTSCSKSNLDATPGCPPAVQTSASESPATFEQPAATNSDNSNASQASSDSSPQTKDYLASDFKKLMSGKTKQEIIAILGKPRKVEEGIQEGSQYYDYSFSQVYTGPTVFDDVTHVQMKEITIWFDSVGNCVDVHISQT